ncbi:MAG: site-2 protease family protein [Candidatus Taylorbacteria bacterium]|nr:site-2 protease family protein [Candidatus Taylorbacteria bacterium]
MYILVFIIILGILIFVHELGHFLAAKSFGIRVDEFALGFPPRLVSKKVGETQYSLNLIPIGGYVKILGEDGSEEAEKAAEPSRGKRFTDVSRWKQAVVLVSGILGNLLFAWLAVSIGFMFGLPTAAEGPFASEIRERALIITSVLPGSPADESGVLPGDKIIELRGQDEALVAPDAEAASELISETPPNVPINMVVSRQTGTTSIQTLAEEGVIEGKRGIGISMEYAGVLQLPPHKALVAGAYATVSITQAVAAGVYNIIGDAFRGEAELSSFTGPVGIAMMVGDAEKAGFVNLLILVVIISINLAVINILPLPALDGGRLLFVTIESIRRKPINQRFAHMSNQIGLIALLLLMAVITYKDIIKLFK